MRSVIKDPKHIICFAQCRALANAKIGMYKQTRSVATARLTLKRIRILYAKSPASKYNTSTNIVKQTVSITRNGPWYFCLETITQIVCPFRGGNTISSSGDLDLEIIRVCQSSFKRAVGRTVADRGKRTQDIPPDSTSSVMATQTRLVAGPTLAILQMLCVLSGIQVSGKH